MTIKGLISAAAVVTMGTLGVQAADLVIVPDDVVVEAAPRLNVYVQLLGGGAFAGLDTTFVGQPPYAMEGGVAAAATIGVVVMEGLSVEADLFYSSRAYDPDDFDPNSSVSTLSLMANLKYTFEVSEGIGLYAAAGVGYIHLTDDEDGDIYELSGAGYQLIVGATAELADNISLVGELRYQDGFADLEADGLIPMDSPVAAALVGVKFGF